MQDNSTHTLTEWQKAVSREGHRPGSPCDLQGWEWGASRACWWRWWWSWPGFWRPGWGGGRPAVGATPAWKRLKLAGARRWQNQFVFVAQDKKTSSLPFQCSQLGCGCNWWFSRCRASSGFSNTFLDSCTWVWPESDQAGLPRKLLRNLIGTRCFYLDLFKGRLSLLKTFAFLTGDVILLLNILFDEQLSFWWWWWSWCCWPQILQWSCPPITVIS